MEGLERVLHKKCIVIRVFVCGRNVGRNKNNTQVKIMTTYTREELSKGLHEGVCEVSFKKVNGDTRVMTCTLSGFELSRKSIPESKTTKTKAVNEKILSVWDVDADGWRSFRVENVFDFKTEEECDCFIQVLFITYKQVVLSTKFTYNIRMKLRIMSDLHLEFHDGKWEQEFDIPAMDDDKDTVLVLPGDIHNAKQLAKVYERFAPRFKAIVGVFGNHEYYKRSIVNAIDKVQAQIGHLDNVHLLDQTTVEIDDVVFVGATLWAGFDNLNQLAMYDASLSIRDYKYIRDGSNAVPYARKLRPVVTAQLHLQHRDFMFKAIDEAKAAGKKVVGVSHHLPSELCLPEQYRVRYTGKPYRNGAYASELFEWMADSKPDLWIHGHTHESMDVMVADTRVVCNPRGYVNESPEDLNSNFDFMFSVEV